MEPSDALRTKKDICLHLGDEYDRHLGSIVPPLFQTSLFTRKTMNHGYTYSRVANPTVELVETKLAALEGGEAARCFSSGMGAITAVLMRALTRDAHVIVPRTVYFPVKVFLRDYMSKFGIEVTFVSGTDVEEYERSIRPNTKMIYVETPLSNVFTLQPLEELARLAKAHGIMTMADNTWATPLYQNPLDFGIDIVVHSATKYLGGHSDILGGAAIGAKSLMEALANDERGLFGAVMDPHQAWLLTRGIRTLPLRMKQHQESAQRIAAFLEAHPKVERVLYPGLRSHPQYDLGQKQMNGYTGLMSFIPKGSTESIRAFVKSLRVFEEGPSWGGFESLVNTPGVGVNSEALADNGIPEGLVRISIGLEDEGTILNDLDQALLSNL
jgi:cystathionine beta-lyase/cystathionine gamma-synthase